MHIITDNGENFYIPYDNILSANLDCHSIITKDDHKSYINKMKLTIKSTKDITLDGVDNDDDLAFADRITKYNDIRKIEHLGNVYTLSWIFDPKKLRENKCQTSYVDANGVVTIKLFYDHKQNSKQDNNRG